MTCDHRYAFRQHTEMGQDKDMGQDPLIGNVAKGMWISTYMAGLNETLKCNVKEKRDIGWSIISV